MKILRIRAFDKLCDYESNFDTLALIQWRPHIRTMLNRTSLLFEQNLPGTDRIELILSKKALIIVQKSPDNGTILYPRFVVNDNEFHFLLLHLQYL